MRKVAAGSDPQAGEFLIGVEKAALVFPEIHFAFQGGFEQGLVRHAGRDVF
ncbi:MAG: hypothetical protein HZB24_02720 [Desulfobacterales bacterium]|nr:hypothetical protein [Desulfobacterales bacterium]